MYKILFLLLIASTSASFGIHESFAQMSELFTYTLPSGLSEQELSMTPDKYAIQSKSVIVNVNALSSDQVRMNFFNDTITVSKDRIISRSATDYTWFGSNADGANVVFVVNGIDILGSVTYQNKTYVILPSYDVNVHEIRDLDISKFPLAYDYDEDESGHITNSSQYSPIQHN